MNVFESIAYLEPILTLDLLNPTDSGRMYAQRTYFSSKRASPLQVFYDFTPSSRNNQSIMA
jgi:hypothetical protein